MTNKLAILALAILLPCANAAADDPDFPENGAFAINESELTLKDGKLGIHELNPSAELHVNGHIIVTGDTTAPPLKGKLLTATGPTGQAAWQDPAPTGFKNRLINGMLDVWQRGGTFSSYSGYSADRWLTEAVNAAEPPLIERGVPLSGTDMPFRYYLKASGANTNHIGMRQQIEFAHFHDLMGKTATFSFWAKALTDNEESKNIRVWSSQSTDQDASLLTNIYAGTETSTMTLSTTEWRHVVTNININGDTRALAVGVVLGSVDDPVSTNTRSVGIGGLQLELGDLATAFEQRPYATELQLCQRYYEKSYAPETSPGTPETASVIETGAISDNSTMVLSLPTVNYKIPKRVTPSVTFYSPSGASGNCAWYTDFGTAQNLATTTERTGVNGFMARQSADLNAYDHMVCHFTADAEFH